MKCWFWYDNLSRDILENGFLKEIINDGISGVTSNPTIFKLAIEGSSLYDEKILRNSNRPVEEICWELMCDDVRDACDFLIPVFEQSEHQSGYVSIELNPLHANDFQSSVHQAMELNRKIDRPNLMIKVPATSAGFKVIRELTSQGLNVNVTLIFSKDQYLRCAESYVLGLEDRLKKGLDLNGIFSVASFFVSRVDAAVGSLIESRVVDEKYRNQVSVRNCQLVYHFFQRFFGSKRFEKLTRSGAKRQLVLWASTGVKDPTLDPGYYLDRLMFDDVVFTLPDQTLKNARERSVLKNPIQSEIYEEFELLKWFLEFDSSGFSLEYILWELTERGVELFAQSYEQLLKAVEFKLSKLQQSANDAG